MLHLVPFHTPTYPHGPPDSEIAADIFPGGFKATLNEITLVSLDYV